MKAAILQYMTSLIDCEDPAEMKSIHKELVRLINEADFDMDADNAKQVKRLVTATIKNYVDTSDAALKSALEEHHNTLNLFVITNPD